ncbi:hypothetical protein [Clostridium sp.]|uniref:hypothetical protein n=1 Tax=Clostridium sp. TaxID=1506 RepID=UPI003D6C93CF
MKKNKKGSSLLLVLIVCSILSILGMSMISMATSNYKMKILKGNIKTNMYASESGIDESYGIIGKMVDEAIIKGNDEVKIFMVTLDLNEKIKKKETLKSKMIEKRVVEARLNNLDDDDAERVVLNEKSQELDSYINNDDNDSIYVKPTDLVDLYKKDMDISQINLVVNLEYIKEKQNEKFKEAYTKYIVGKLDLIDVSIVPDDTKKENLIAALNTKYTFIMPEDQKSVVYIENFDTSKAFNNMSFTNDILNVKLESVYKNKNIEKIIKADYEIGIPDYEDALSIENDSKDISKNIVWSKAICADGNLEVKDTSKMDINGNVYIRGESNVSNSGISIENSEFNVNGDISTLNDLNLISANNTTNVDGSIYAKNIILTETAKNSNLVSTGSAYTSDDLELNSTEKGVIDIKGDFYGLQKGDVSTTDDASSSIIINSDDLGTGSSLTIGGKSIIMGTSYINTSPEKYQTGEAVSIKGNYRAYMEPLTNIDETDRLKSGKESLKEENIIFDADKYKPLIPADKFVSDNYLNVFDKSDYIKYYIQQKDKNMKENYLKTKGVNIDLEKSYHIGAIIDEDGQWKESKVELDILSLVKKKNNKYKKMAYFMGEESITDKELDDFDDFNGTVVAKQLSSSRIASNTIENNKFIIKKDDYALVFSNGDTSKIPTSLSNESIKPMSSIYEGIIIVDGDLYICGEMNFTGTIICTGSIYIVDDKYKKITYDENVVKNIIATNYDVFKDIFKESSNKINVVTDAKISSTGNSSLSVNSNKLIKLKNWSLVK